jgi:hypothetical protein
VLLCFVSVFLIGWFFKEQLLVLPNRKATAAAWLFAAGVVFNEVLLMLQGVTAMLSEPFAGVNYFLLLAACIIFTALLGLFVFQKTKLQQP